ncbi:SIMPL domain-containing protein [Candidatus Daviesbacteria bacterium]|nr:SIMPL domain-containing protein [Candidatus Daviesbacteria bacterium]
MRTIATVAAPILIFFFLLFAYTKIAGPIPFSVTSVTTTKTDTFNVTGEGFVAAKPDIATLNVGIQAQGSTVKAAQDQINAAINKVAEAIKKLGVEQKDIQTQNYQINPNYDFQGPTQRITGYSASTNLSIKVRKIDLVNQVIDEATANGANLVGSISFDVDDKAKVENEARQKAVETAKKKAENAAKIAGFRLGRLVNYSENFGGGPEPILLRAMAAPGGGEKPDTSIEPGSSEIKVVVTLSYEIL